MAEGRDYVVEAKKKKENVSETINYVTVNKNENIVAERIDYVIEKKKHILCLKECV